MRVIQVEPESKHDRWVLWLVAGAAIGVAAGVLAAEKSRGRRPNLRTLRKRLLGIASLAGKQWGPLVDLAFELKDEWDERRAARPLTADVAHDDDEDVDDLEDADEYAEAEAPLDEDFGDDFDEEELDEDEVGIGERVLEVFANDPILAERAVEIDADDDGDVILYGRVRAAREVAHAVTLARGVPGVTRVRQQLSVRPRR